MSNFARILAVSLLDLIFIRWIFVCFFARKNVSCKDFGHSIAVVVVARTALVTNRASVRGHVRPGGSRRSDTSDSRMIV